MSYAVPSARFNWRDGVAVHFPSRITTKDFNKRYSQIPCLALSTKGIVWRTSQKICLLCPKATHYMGCHPSFRGGQMAGPSSLPVVVAQSN